MTETRPRGSRRALPIPVPGTSGRNLPGWVGLVWSPWSPAGSISPAPPRTASRARRCPTGSPSAGARSRAPPAWRLPVERRCRRDPGRWEALRRRPGRRWLRPARPAGRSRPRHRSSDVTPPPAPSRPSRRRAGWSRCSTAPSRGLLVGGGRRRRRRGPRVGGRARQPSSGRRRLRRRVLGPKGPVESPGLGGLSLGSGKSTKLRPRRGRAEPGDLAVGVTTSVAGDVSPAGAWAPPGDRQPTREWVPAQPGPARSMVVLGAPDKPDSATLLVANPSSTEAIVKIEGSRLRPAHSRRRTSRRSTSPRCRRRCAPQGGLRRQAGRDQGHRAGAGHRDRALGRRR